MARTSRFYRLCTAAAFGLAVVGCAASWVWTHHLQTTGRVIAGYWVGVVGSSLPALALTASLVWRWREHARGEASASRSP